MSLGFVLAILVSGFFTGALARFAIPGPDPMPIWLTLAIGLTGSIVGAVVGKAISNDNAYVISFLSLRRRDRARRVLPAFRAATASVRAGRARVPEDGSRRRASSGPGCRSSESTPTSSGPIRSASSTRGSPPLLEELHRAGLLDDDELAAKRTRLDQLVG